MGPPKKRGAGRQASSPKRTPLFLSSAECQTDVWAHWQQHALWMLAAYSRTGDFKHLLAFVRHFHAMREKSLLR
jgi:hypothetical protein